MVVVNSRCVDLFDAHEQRTVLGHEAGHILSDHVLYRTALLILISLGPGRLPFFAGLPLLGVKLALLEWFRCAELSCDRAATLVNRDPLVTCRTMMVLAGGVSARQLDLDAFIRQAGEYEDWDSGWDKVNRLSSELMLTHCLSRAARQGDHGLGPVRRLRPDRRRRLPHARRDRRRAQGGGRRGRLLRRALPPHPQGRRRRARQGGRQRVRRGGRRSATGSAPATRAAARGSASWRRRRTPTITTSPVTATRRRPAPTGAGWPSRSR